MRSARLIAGRLISQHARSIASRPPWAVRVLTAKRCLSSSIVRRDDDEETIEELIEPSSVTSPDAVLPFYDALFTPSTLEEVGLDEEPEEQDKQNKEEEQDAAGPTMRVMLDKAGESSQRTIVVPLPDEQHSPDLCEHLSYEDVNESVFNRLTLPDQNVRLYHWETTTQDCSSASKEWLAAHSKHPLPSYPGLAIPPIRSRSPRLWKSLSSETPRVTPPIRSRSPPLWRSLPYDPGLASTPAGPGSSHSREDETLASIDPVTRLEREMEQLDLLEREMEQLNIDAAVSGYEIAARRSLGEAFVRLIASFLGPNHIVELYGTTVAGPILPFCDINIRFREKSALSLSTFTPEEIARADDNIHAITRLLYTMQEEVGQVYALPTQVYSADVLPEVEFVHKYTQFKFRITSCKATQRQERFLKYLERQDHFVSLYRLLRTSLHVRRLTNVHAGGISSYTIRAMIEAWRIRGQVPSTAAGQLRSFLAYWSAFDTRKYGASAQTGLFRLHKRSLELQHYSAAAARRDDIVRAGQWTISALRTPYPWMLRLQNPSYRTDDLGKGAFAMKHILRTFQYLHIKLEKAIKAAQAGRVVEGDLLSPFIGNFGSALSDAKWKREIVLKKYFRRTGM